MSNSQEEKIHEAILELNKSMLHNPDDFELYYQRGYLYYSLDDIENSEEDYRKAVSLGLDCTKYPYYGFNSFPQRNYSLKDKIILILFLLFFVAMLLLESYQSVYRLLH